MLTRSLLKALLFETFVPRTAICPGLCNAEARKEALRLHRWDRELNRWHE
jgi:hypothetical protein